MQRLSHTYRKSPRSLPHELASITVLWSKAKLILGTGACYNPWCWLTVVLRRAVFSLGCALLALGLAFTVGEHRPGPR